MSRAEQLRQQWKEANENPFFGLLLSPVGAAAAMALSSVSVITNALRLRAIEVN